VHTYSPKAHARQAGVPTRIDTTQFISVGTTNYQLPWTICVAFEGFVSVGPANPVTLGTIRVISKITMIGKAA